MQLRSDVDDVDLYRLPVMRTQVVTTGALLIEKEQAVRQRFDMQTPAPYAF